MKNTLATLLASICFLLIASAPPTHAQDDPVDFDYFYDNLASYGDWIEVEGYGYCFRPFVASENPDWQPYTEGSWAETEGGWTWVSEEEFGWATYHYGRWVFIDTFWAWVPGYEWAPAWVSWRTGGDYVGWAPLPPEAQWSNDRGFDSSVDVVYDIGPRYYNFIPIIHFGATNYRPHLIGRDRNITIIRETTNITSISYHQSDIRLNRIHIGGPRYDDLSRRSEQNIRRLKLIQHRDRGNDRQHHRSRVENDRFSVFAPSITRKENRNIAPREVKMKTNRDKIDRGWRGVAQEQASQLRQRIAEEKRPERDGNGPRGERGNRDNNDRDNKGPDRAIPIPNMPGQRDRDRDGENKGPRGDRGDNNNDRKGPDGAMPGQRDRESADRDPRMPRPGPDRNPGSDSNPTMPREGREKEDAEQRRRDMPTPGNRPDRKPEDQLPPGRVMPKPEESSQRSTPPANMPRPDRKPDEPRNKPEAVAPPQNRRAPGAGPGNSQNEPKRPEPRKMEERAPQPRREQPRPSAPPTQRSEKPAQEKVRERPPTPTPTPRKENKSEARQERPRSAEPSRKESPKPQAQAERREPERKKAEAPKPEQRQPQERPKSSGNKPERKGGEDDERRKKKD
ncbi:hypothetical protein FEM03_19535 [Phragmitibacter flavus]|uniref:Uncharacterized protein n=1 Tax=Phragmitibacter flavus TaxID=2576071 RepID=A0A5R8K9S1_9BACT|nr:DUF6600 domain-containing protein [Phragmitibacter flavus]TLD69063.1 hypothetical protein FEM03_19535 [Phragmitibacter flavus]